MTTDTATSAVNIDTLTNGIKASVFSHTSVVDDPFTACADVPQELLCQVYELHKGGARLPPAEILNDCSRLKQWIDTTSKDPTVQRSLKNQETERPQSEKVKDTSKVLPFFERDGRLYLDAIEPGGRFGFIHEEGGKVLFATDVLENGSAIKPTELPLHHDTNEMAFVVGVPKSDLVINAPLLSPDELYQLLNHHVYKYCDIADLDRELHIYYAIYTWFYTKCQTSPYLRYLADTGKGKSRLKDVISGLCFYPIRATGISTVSGIMRYHERWKGTLVIDEGDLNGGMENPFIKFLNVGFEKGNYVIMSDTSDPKKQVFFDPFGPKVIAMRKAFKDNATEGRCLSYSPNETNRKDISPELPPTYYRELEELRAKIARFVLHHWQDVDGNIMMEYAGFDIERRLIQMIRPISVILQVFPDGRKRLDQHLGARQKEIKRIRSESWEGGIFNYAYSIAMGYESEDGILPQVVRSADIATVYKTTTTNITATLKSIGFEIETDRIEINDKEGKKKKKVVKKLVVPNPQAWGEIVRRYWYNEDNSLTPDCPDNLRGKHWVDPQRKIDFDKTCNTCTTCNTYLAGGVGDHNPNPQNNSDENIFNSSSINSEPTITQEKEINPVAKPLQPLQPFQSLIKNYDLPEDSDITQHIRLTKKGESCICKGCGEPAVWHSSDTIRPLPLCDEHYKEIKESR